jgi:uncharacterized protein (DUF1778 family)
MTKSQQLQIRVTPQQKAALKRRAERAGQDVSRYVLERALPSAAIRFEEILRALREERSHRFALAELSDLLAALASTELAEAVGDADLAELSPFLRSYVAAMVEVAARREGVEPPAWTADVGGVDEPYFAADLPGLRLHLLRSSPVPFKRRNLFVDATVGDRV